MMSMAKYTDLQVLCANKRCTSLSTCWNEIKKWGAVNRTTWFESLSLFSLFNLRVIDNLKVSSLISRDSTMALIRFTHFLQSKQGMEYYVLRKFNHLTVACMRISILQTTSDVCSVIYLFDLLKMNHSYLF